MHKKHLFVKKSIAIEVKHKELVTKVGLGEVKI